jgi:hypothetical protein
MPRRRFPNFSLQLKPEKTWKEQIRAGHLPRKLAWESMKTTILRTLHYPLPATTLTKTQCDAIWVRSYKEGCHVQASSAPSPAHWCTDPSNIKGSVFPICTRVKAIHTSNELLNTATLTRTSTVALPYAKFAGLATKYWLQQTRHFMDAYQMRIEDTSPDFLLSRANDQLLIPLFHRHGIRGQRLHRINLCRLYIQVLTIFQISPQAAAPRLPKLHGTKACQPAGVLAPMEAECRAALMKFNPPSALLLLVSVLPLKGLLLIVLLTSSG